MPSFCHALVKNRKKIPQDKPLTRLQLKNWQKPRYCQNKTKTEEIYCYLHSRLQGKSGVVFCSTVKVIVFLKKSSVARGYVEDYSQPTKT